MSLTHGVMKDPFSMENAKSIEATIQGASNGRQKIKKKFSQTIFRDWCKSCGICVAFCPKGVIVINENGLPKISDPDLCIGCRFCEVHCPDFAITIR